MTRPSGNSQKMPELVLGSSSPRRRDMLARIGVEPARIASPDIDETPLDGELPRSYALRMAREKAAAISRGTSEIIIAGDTSVALGRRILPPAETPEIQRRLLAQISGRRHHVWSAICVIDAEGKARSRISKNIVRFKRLSAQEIDAYLATEEGLGKAGGYAIQGRAEALIDWISGSHSGIIGLPLYETRILLKSAGYGVD